MQVGTILLTIENQYVKDNGSLPRRRDFDKAMLTALVGLVGLVSDKAYNKLPPSIQDICSPCAGDSLEKFPITIGELDDCDLLIISRSAEKFDGGKVFRLTNYRCIVKDKKVELWISKH